MGGSIHMSTSFAWLDAEKLDIGRTDCVEMNWRFG